MKALDLFCGGGGACLGMQWAGFEVYGVDIKPHRNYPGHFIQGDALNPPVDIMEFDFVWASPPCQLFTPASRNRSENWRKHPNLIPQTQKLLANHPYSCIENVPQAPLRPDLTLWGVQFGLEELWRKRIFELSFWVWNLPRPKMERGKYYTIAGSLGSSNHFYRRKAEGKPGTLSKIEAKHTMGIPICMKMTKSEIVESVAPPMAKYIADEAMRQLRENKGIMHSKKRLTEESMDWKPNMDWARGEFARVSPGKIERHKECQPRVNGIDTEVVQEYAADMREYDEIYRDKDVEGWQKFERLSCIKTEDDRYILVSGFHRLEAILEVGYKDILVYYKSGTFQDAVVLSKSENANNGVRRSNADKEHVVMSCLLDPELRKWSNELIAKWCGVSPNTVKNHEVRLSAKCRDEGKTYERPTERLYLKPDGSVGTKETKEIGKREPFLDVESLRNAVKQRIVEGHYRQSITDLVYAEFKGVDIELEERQTVVRKIYNSIITQDKRMQTLQAFWDTHHDCYDKFCESEFSKLDRINDISWTFFSRAAWGWSKCDFMNVQTYLHNPRSFMVELDAEQIEMMRGQYTLFTQAIVSGKDLTFMEELRKKLPKGQDKPESNSNVTENVKQTAEEREANTLLKRKKKVFKQMWDNRKDVTRIYIGEGDNDLNQYLQLQDLEKGFPKVTSYCADAFRSGMKRTQYATFESCLKRVLESDVSLETLEKEDRALSTYSGDVRTWNSTTQASQWIRDMIAQKSKLKPKPQTAAPVSDKIDILISELKDEMPAWKERNSNSKLEYSQHFMLVEAAAREMNDNYDLNDYTCFYSADLEGVHEEELKYAIDCVREDNRVFIKTVRHVMFGKNDPGILERDYDDNPEFLVQVNSDASDLDEDIKKELTLIFSLHGKIPIYNPSTEMSYSQELAENSTLRPGEIYLQMKKFQAHLDKLEKDVKKSLKEDPTCQPLDLAEAWQENPDVIKKIFANLEMHQKSDNVKQTAEEREAYKKSKSPPRKEEAEPVNLREKVKKSISDWKKRHVGEGVSYVSFSKCMEAACELENIQKERGSSDDQMEQLFSYLEKDSPVFLDTVKKVSGLETTSNGTKIDTEKYEAIRSDLIKELEMLEAAQKNEERLREDNDDVITIVAKKHEVNESVIRHINGMESGISLSLISVYFNDNNKDEFIGADFCPNGEPDTYPLLEWIPEDIVKQLEKIGHIAYLNELNEVIEDD